jgi:hypothetical protein
MSIQVQYRRGSAAENDIFTGALAEITVDTTNKTIRVHDGATAGGSNIATVAYVNNAIGSLSANSITDGTSNVRIVSPNGNVAVSVAGTSNVAVFNSAGANVTGTFGVSGNANVGNLGAATVVATTLTGTLSTAAQPNITSVGTLTSVSVSGNVTAGNVSGSTGAFTAVTGNGRALTSMSAANIDTGTLPSARLSGTYTITVSGAATTAGTVTTAAQPNITSVGTLSSLSVSGNTTSGNFVTAGLVNAGTLQTSGNAIIGGNLIVNGNTINVNISDLNIQDPVIGLGRGANNSPLTTNDGKDRGTQLWYYDTAERSGFIGYDNNTGKLIAAANVSLTGEIVTVNNYGSFVVGAAEAATVSASGNITGGNLLTGGLISATGGIVGASFTGNGQPLTSLNAANIDTGTLPSARLSGTYTITVSGSATTAGTVTTAAQPNITSVGTMAAATITTLTTAGITKSGTNAVGNIGQTDNRFNNVFARASSASYADLAEIYLTDSDYPAGTVVIFGGANEVTESTEYADARLAGVISTNPAFVMNDNAEGQPIALQGRVPCSVVGNIQPGDLITTSNIAGVGTKLDPADWRPGTVLGKALENYNSAEPGIIEVVVGRV